MSANGIIRVNSTRHRIPRAIHTSNLSQHSKPLLEVGVLILSSHIRFVRVVIESMRICYRRVPRYGTLVAR